MRTISSCLVALIKLPFQMGFMFLFAIVIILAIPVVRAQVDPIVDTDKLASTACAIIDCSYLPSFGPPLVNTPVESLLPDLLDTYNEFDGKEIRSLASTLNQHLSTPVNQSKLLDTAFYGLQCYEETGAIGWRLYQHREDQLAVGAIVAINEYEIFSLDNIAQCIANYLGIEITPTSSENTQPLAFCGGTYRYTQVPELIHYRIAYFATKTDTCADFCQALPSCHYISNTW